MHFVGIKWDLLFALWEKIVIGFFYWMAIKPPCHDKGKKIMAKNVKRNVGRPYSDPASARARLHELDIEMKAAIKAHAAFQKQCIADGLLNRVKVDESPVKAHMRAKLEDVWSDQILSIELEKMAKRFA